MDNSLSLYELANKVKESLNSAFPILYRVIAEISDMNESRGHVYLELIEKDRSNKVIAKARATIWSHTYRLLSPYFMTSTGYRLESGLKVLLSVTVEFHEVFGFSLNVKDIDPTYTLGDIARKRAEIIDRLQSEGVINMNKEITFPLIPQRIAIISSGTAAGYDDFTDHLKNNAYGYIFYTKLFESFMQGEETDTSIICALDRIYAHKDLFDVVVIVRGGGSKSELAAFDSYPIALHIAQFPLPILTGIGHERDESIADLVSYKSLKTPTAVADFFISKFIDLSADLDQYEKQVGLFCKEFIHNHKELYHQLSIKFKIKALEHIKLTKINLAKISTHTEIITRNYIEKMSIGLEKIGALLRHGFKHNIHTKKSKSDLFILKFKNTVNTFLKEKRNQTKLLTQKKEFSDPQILLKKGYSLTYLSGKPLKSVDQVKIDDVVETKLFDGSFRSIVKN